MDSTSTGASYVVWGLELDSYGPLDLPTLVSWVKSQRVTAETWVFVQKEGAWKRALDIFELQLFFWAGRGGPPTKLAMGAENGIDPRSLRRLRILAGMSDDQLDRFCQFTELLQVPQRATIVKQGDRGDAMYLVLQGDLRVCLNVAGTETILATLTAGDFFGDISLFDHGPRSADVMAESTATLLKLSASRFRDMARQSPDLATPFLLAIGRTLTARIRTANKHRGEAVQFARVTE
jgi:CRP/FNR family transcriptional regulator/CRP/FNR family cyclic AMP-dependent transcriptional regulator